MDTSRVTLDLMMRRRNLPHWQIGGSVYFITFRSVRVELPESARILTIKHVLHDHGKKHDFHFGVVMPDHVHLILQPLPVSEGCWYDLAEIMKGIKGVSSRRINQLLGTRGAVWQDESYDRIIRDQAEYEAKVKYIWENPIRAGLVTAVEDYRYYIFPPDVDVEQPS